MIFLCSDCNKHQKVTCPFHSNNRFRKDDDEAPQSCFNIDPPEGKVWMVVESAGTEICREAFDHGIKSDRNAMRLIVWHSVQKKYSVTTMPYEE